MQYQIVCKKKKDEKFLFENEKCFFQQKTTYDKLPIHSMDSIPAAMKKVQWTLSINNHKLIDYNRLIVRNR